MTLKNLKFLSVSSFPASILLLTSLSIAPILQNYSAAIWYLQPLGQLRNHFRESSPPQFFFILIDFELISNALAQLPENLFSCNTNLMTIDVSTIWTQFRFFPNISKLSYNRMISTMPHDLFHPLTKLQNLNVRSPQALHPIFFFGSLPGMEPNPSSQPPLA